MLLLLCLLSECGCNSVSLLAGVLGRPVNHHGGLQAYATLQGYAVLLLLQRLTCSSKYVQLIRLLLVCLGQCSCQLASSLFTITGMLREIVTLCYSPGGGQ